MTFDRGAGDCQAKRSWPNDLLVTQAVEALEIACGIRRTPGPSSSMLPTTSPPTFDARISPAAGLEKGCVVDSAIARGQAARRTQISALPPAPREGASDLSLEALASQAPEQRFNQPAQGRPARIAPAKLASRRDIAAYRRLPIDRTTRFSPLHHWLRTASSRPVEAFDRRSTKRRFLLM